MPAATVEWVLSEVLSHGRVRRAYLGIAGRTRQLDRRLVRALDLAAEQALEVITREPEGPAAQSDLRIGDLILAAEAQPVTSVDSLHRFLSRWTIGQPVMLTVLRRTQRLQIEVMPVEVPPR